MRADKVVGSGLSAEVALFCDNQLAQQLGRLGEELRFALIVSSVRVLPLSEAAVGEAADTDLPGLKLSIKPSEYEKCERCWHHSETVGGNEKHPTLCARCVDNIDGSGEERQFA